MSTKKLTIDQINNYVRTPQGAQYLSLIWLAAWLVIPTFLDKTDELNGLILAAICVGCLAFAWSSAGIVKEKARPYTFIVTAVLSFVISYYLYVLLSVLFSLA